MNKTEVQVKKKKKEDKKKEQLRSASSIQETVLDAVTFLIDTQ